MTLPDLSALVSSRICHDLISPVGAIGNGVELLSSIPGGPGEELALISDSVSTATQKLRCFRLAFGAAPAGASVSAAETKTAVQSLFQGRYAANMSLQAGDPRRATVKALLLTILCQEKALPLGGTSAIDLRRDGFQIDTAAPKLREDRALWALIDRPGLPADLAAAEVQFPLLGQCLRDAGARLERHFEDTHIRLEVTGFA
ncbi:MAG: histidine phosphotransferase family protein [Pseudomonadota bacterium]